MAEQIISKRCSKCKILKPISTFNKDSRYKDGYFCWCKQCKSQWNQKYLKTENGIDVNKRACTKYSKTQKGKAAFRRYHRSEKGKVTAKRFRQTEKCKLSHVRYMRSEKRKRSFQKYQVLHPEQIQARHAVSNAIRGGKIKPVNQCQCQYCENIAQIYHHHLGYEPEHWFDVIPVCRPCHYILHNYTPRFAPSTGTMPFSMPPSSRF